MGPLYSATKKYTFIVFLFAFIYSALWFIVAGNLKNHITNLLRFDSSEFRISLECEDITITNFPFIPQILLLAPFIKINYGQSATAPFFKLSFEGDMLVSSNINFNEFHLQLPNKLLADQVECYGLKTLKVATNNSVIFGNKMHGLANLDYPDSQIHCRTKPSDSKNEILNETITMMLQIKRDGLNTKAEALHINAKYQGNNGKIILYTQIAQSPQTPITFNLLDVMISNSMANYQINLKTTPGNQFTLVNQLEYRGKLLIEMHNYRNAIRSFFPFSKPDMLPQIYRILGKYANELKGSDLHLILSGTSNRIMFGKYELPLFVKEIHEELTN